MSSWEKFLFIPLISGGLAVVGYLAARPRPLIGSILAALATLSALWAWYSPYEGFAMRDPFVLVEVVGVLLVSIAALGRTRWPDLSRGLAVGGVLALAAVFAFVVFVMVWFIASGGPGY